MATQLRSLKLQAHAWHFAQGIWARADDKSDRGLHYLLQQALPKLTALTRLEVQQLTDTCILKCAPPQLLELSAMGVQDKQDA